jgi:endonuclease YncB( thermonuclease family)
MFWFLHYTVKVLIGLAVVGLGVFVYVRRDAWFKPADAWVETLRHVETETLPVLGETTGTVTRVPSGQLVVIRSPEGKSLTFRVAGILAPPPAARNPRGLKAEAFRFSRDHLLELALSNDVRVAYTFFVAHGGGLGGVYSGDTNLAVSLLSAGAALVDKATLKCLPVIEQVQLLAAEKSAREGKVGLWGDPEMLEAVQETVLTSR